MPAVSAIDTFIQGAPDARPGAASSNRASSASRQRQVKRKISVDIDPDLLARVDEAARASGISRNAALAIGALHFLNEALRRAN